MRIFLICLILSVAAKAQPFSVFFDTDKSTIKSSYTEVLKKAIEVAKKSKSPMVIECHCDNRADSSYNYNLSMRRAKAVQQYLKKGGTTAEIKVIGFGESNPTYANDAQTRHKNRRCDIKLGEGGTDINFTEIDVKNVSKGDLLQLDGLEFVGNQALPNYYSMPVLYKLLEVMQTQADLEIKLLGHVCCSDDMPLSIARAEAVYTFLINNGIDSARLSYQGFSNTKPKVKEVDEKTKQQNRRVEILILKNSERSVEPNKMNKQITFGVVLRDIPFRENTRFLEKSGEYNLNFVAEMIKESEGYDYKMIVVSKHQSVTAQRRNTVESFFRKRRIFKDVINFVPSNFYNPDKGDMLILEVKPKLNE